MACPSGCACPGYRAAGPPGAGTFCGRSGEPSAPLRPTGEPVPPCAPSPSGGALWEREQPVPQVVPAGATRPQVQGRAGPGRSRRSETPQGWRCRELPLRGEPLRRLRSTPPLSGEAGLRAAFGGWPWGCWRSPLGERFTAGPVPKRTSPAVLL